MVWCIAVVKCRRLANRRLREGAVRRACDAAECFSVACERFRGADRCRGVTGRVLRAAAGCLRLAGQCLRNGSAASLARSPASGPRQIVSLSRRVASSTRTEVSKGRRNASLARITAPTARSIVTVSRLNASSARPDASSCRSSAYLARRHAPGARRNVPRRGPLVPCRGSASPCRGPFFNRMGSFAAAGDCVGFPREPIRASRKTIEPERGPLVDLRHSRRVRRFPQDTGRHLEQTQGASFKRFSPGDVADAESWSEG